MVPDHLVQKLETMHSKLARLDVPIKPSPLSSECSADCQRELRVLLDELRLAEQEIVRQLEKLHDGQKDRQRERQHCLDLKTDLEKRNQERTVQLEAARAEAERLCREAQEASRRKDQFLAMLAHELRNPLAPVFNALHVIRLSASMGPTVQQCLAVADRQLRHMAALLDDLLDVSRVSTGKIRLRWKRANLANIVREAIEISQPLIDARQHHLTVQLPPETVLLQADPNRLEQVISNLLNNAAKYTEPGGHIWLTVERADKEIRVRVRDDGIGIAPALLPYVFDLFTQADQSLDRAHGGLGIGLTLVRSLVAMHGGSVQASSLGPGHGSEFIVSLPVEGEDRSVEDGSASNLPKRPAHPLRVLVVDDHADAADSLALLLNLAGHQASTAYDGKSALAAVENQRPDVVLLDIGLPGMDGYQVAQRLRSQIELAHIYLVALTGYGQEADRREARKAGFDHHLTKPVEPDELSRVLDRCAFSVDRKRFNGAP